MKNPSFALRVVGFLIVAQFPALLITWFLAHGMSLLGLGKFDFSLDDLAVVRADSLVIDSLVKGEDRQDRIEPTLELRTEMLRVPGFQFAAFDPSGGIPLAGSSPELVAALRGLSQARPVHMHFAKPNDGLRDYAGHLNLKITPFGPLQIATYGYKVRWDDIFYNLKSDLVWNAVYSSGAILFTGAIAWIAVRRGLAPLTAVMRGVGRIDMNSLHQRLPVEDVPSEINPLVNAMNEALTRLDVGAARQRRFTANAAHELRTPVAILSARLDAPEEPSFKNDLKRDARHIRNIVEQLLATARLGECPCEIDQQVDLVSAVRAMVTDAALLAIRNGRHIAFEASPTPLLVYGSRPALEAVIANLIDNALRAEPVGGTVLVRVGGEAPVEVIDHGEGVAESDREVIFEPFWRKADTKPGTGLGLAIAKELIDLHRGRIWVDGTPGGGATFKLSFPAMK